MNDGTVTLRFHVDVEGGNASHKPCGDFVLEISRHDWDLSHEESLKGATNILWWKIDDAIHLPTTEAST